MPFDCGLATGVKHGTRFGLLMRGIENTLSDFDGAVHALMRRIGSVPAFRPRWAGLIWENNFRD